MYVLRVGHNGPDPTPRIQRVDPWGWRGLAFLIYLTSARAPHLGRELERRAGLVSQARLGLLIMLE